MNATSMFSPDFLIEAGLGDRIILPGSADYGVREDSYWSNTSKICPACIIQPTSAEEVSKAIQALKKQSQKFAIRSGGHMHCSGSNNISNGVTIDLGLLDSVTFDAASESVDIGPGALWSQVYTELEKHQRVVNGGREGHVGVAGFLLGGGMTYFTGRRGFGCDDVISYELVVSDGRILTVDKDSHVDLFKALKGGSSNFGVVTKFTMGSFPCPKVWGGMLFYPKTTVASVLSVLQSFVEDVHQDVDSNILCFVTYTVSNSTTSAHAKFKCVGLIRIDDAQPTFKDIVVATALVQVGGVEEAPAFKKWLDLPFTASTCKMTTIPEITSEYTPAPRGSHNVMLTLTVKNDTRITAKAVELHATLVEDLKQFIPTGTFTTQCLFQPLPTVFGKVSAEKGGNSLGIKEQKEDGILFVAIAMMETSGHYEFAYPKVKAWVDGVADYADTIENGKLDWVYVNYADKSQDPLASYGSENVDRLRRVAAEYDSEGVFQTLCPGGFKVSDIR